jgi:hypothetical protein
VITLAATPEAVTTTVAAVMTNRVALIINRLNHEVD